jgi:hypothetical protein
MKQEEDYLAKTESKVYGENKVNTTYTLTPTAKRKLKELGKSIGLNASAFLEAIARGEVEVKSNSPNPRTVGEFVAS